MRRHWRAAVRTEIEQAGGHAIHVAADLTKFAEIEAMRRRIEEEFGPIDILVANAVTTPLDSRDACFIRVAGRRCQP
jgi:NAD(P)-dependent dehydrogenase (short-subunit alcohol dehydrogenase family)